MEFKKVKKNDDEIIRKIAVLRVEAYENDECVNFKKYPFGWKDELDDEGIHFIAIESDTIIGSCRINVAKNIFEIPYFSNLKNEIELNDKVIYFSRLVVHPDYQNRGIGRRLEEERYGYAIKNEIQNLYIIAENWRIEKLEMQGFRKIYDLKMIKGIEMNKWYSGKEVLLYKKLDL